MKSLLMTYGEALESFISGIYLDSDCCGTPQTRERGIFQYS